MSTGTSGLVAIRSQAAAIAASVDWGFLPETTNRSVEEITHVFDEQAAGGGRTGIPRAQDANAAAA